MKKLIALLSLLFVFTTQGPNNYSTIANDSTVGDVNWTLAGACGVASATASLAGPGAEMTHYAKMTGFGFTIPTGATINGIEAVVTNASCVNLNTRDNSVKLCIAGTISGSDLSASAAWSASPANKTFGGSSQLWGLTPTYSDVNNSGFGFALSVIQIDDNGDPDDVSWDCGTLKIYYTAASGHRFRVIGRLGIAPLTEQLN